MKTLTGAKLNKVRKAWRKTYGVGGGRVPSGLVARAGRIRLVNEDVLKLSRKMKAARSVGVGLTGGELEVLTVEGSQTLAEGLRKNVIEFEERSQAEKWMSGASFDAGELPRPLKPDAKFVVARFKEDWLGSGVVKGGRVVPDIPGWRRLMLK